MTELDFRTFEAVGALVVVLDVDGGIVYWNRSCSDLTGYSLDEIRGLKLWDFALAPEEVESVKAVFAKLQTAALPSGFANHWVTKTGERRWIAWSNRLISGPDGGSSFFIKTGVDQTERKLAEDKLAGIIGIASDAIISVDGEQRIVMFNRGAESIFGWSAAEVVGKPLEVLLPERFRDVHRKHLLGFAGGDVTARQMGQRIPAIFGLRKNGEEFPAQAAISKLEVGGDRLFTVVLRDVTEQSRRDRERDLLARDLREANEQMVSATIRAQELTDEAEQAKARITESERELREVAEFREMFIGIAGHDLRNPLGAIAMTAASLLRHGHLDEQAQKQVARIIRSKERMSKMIAQLLDLTRVRLGGGFPFEPKPTDLRDVCRQVAEEFEAPIQLEVEGNLTGVWDPDRLAEALSNIAGNAIEHAAPGTAVVVKAHPEGAEVVVEIINHGEPIPDNVLPFIFEPFRRGPQPKPAISGNLGLGLYIAKQIVSSGGGQLVAHSTDGTTTFLMRLPRQPPAGAQGQHLPPSEASDQTGWGAVPAR